MRSDILFMVIRLFETQRNNLAIWMRHDTSYLPSSSGLFLYRLGRGRHSSLVSTGLATGQIKESDDRRLVRRSESGFLLVHPCFVLRKLHGGEREEENCFVVA